MDNSIKKMIEMRQTANREILKNIAEMVEKYPDLRFGQILANLGIIQYTHDLDIDSISLSPISTVVDPFSEESVITLNRISRIKNNTK